MRIPQGTALCNLSLSSVMLTSVWIRQRNTDDALYKHDDDTCNDDDGDDICNDDDTCNDDTCNDDDTCNELMVWWLLGSSNTMMTMIHVMMMDMQ